MPRRIFVNDNPQKSHKKCTIPALSANQRTLVYDFILKISRWLALYRMPKMSSVTSLATKSNPNKMSATMMLVATTTFMA